MRASSECEDGFAETIATKTAFENTTKAGLSTERARVARHCLKALKRDTSAMVIGGESDGGCVGVRCSSVVLRLFVPVP